MTGVNKAAPSSPASDGSKSIARDEVEGKMDGSSIKLQKACVNCRRSKVKCVHEGKPPCRRCKDNHQECKFRLRADDEFWRERTDETLSKLSQAVDTLLHREPVAAAAPPTLQQAHSSTSHAALRPTIPARNMSAPGLYMNHTPFSPSSGHMPSIMRPSALGQIHLPQIPAYPHGPTGYDPRSPSNRDGTSSSEGTSPSFDRKTLNVRKRELPSEWEHDGYGQPTNSFRSPGSLASTSTPSQQHPRPINSPTVVSGPPAPTYLQPDQILPSPVLSYVGASQVPLHVQVYSGGTRWMMGNTTSYAKATLTIGRDDPRMNAISIGLVSMERAKSLFVFFAEKVQPHSFGYPTYPAAEQMTPVIISSILMVSALLDPQARHHHLPLKQDCLASIKPEQEVNVAQPLDPELGIGVEEITGACIASTWLGGEVAWRIARVARWWAIGYLKHFEIPSRSLTLGECLTILPPFRQIDLIDMLRIWLAAFVAEAQQAFIFDRPNLAPNENPMHYVEALRKAFNDPLPTSDSKSSSDTRGSMTGGSGGGSAKHPPPPDRQLMGHASMLHILLNAQRVQREARWAAEAATARENHGNHEYSPIAGATASQNGVVSMAAIRDCVDRVVSSWESWMAETDRWKLEVCSLEDMSSSTSSAMDLTLTYYLTKAHLGSLALEPEYNASVTVARAAAQDARLLQSQTKVISVAKISALAALNLATSPVGFRDRLLYLPAYYHFLFGHCAGFLLLLVQRKSRFLLAGEAKAILDIVEQFSQVYVSDIASHNFHARASSSPHPGLATAEALSRSCQHLRAQAKAGG